MEKFRCPKCMEMTFELSNDSDGYCVPNYDIYGCPQDHNEYEYDCESEFVQLYEYTCSNCNCIINMDEELTATNFILTEQEYQDVLFSLEEWPSSIIEPIKVIDFEENHDPYSRHKESLIFKKDKKVFRFNLYKQDDDGFDTESYSEIFNEYPSGLIAYEVQYYEVIVKENRWLPIDENISNYISMIPTRYEDPNDIFDESKWVKDISEYGIEEDMQ